MRAVICWTEIAGYTAACWRALAARPEVETSILAWPSNFSRTGTQFDRSLTAGLPVRFLEDHEQQDADLVAKLVLERRPDLVLMGGWAERPYRRLPFDRRLAAARMVLAMDTPWTASPRQRFARLKIGRYVDRLDGIFVPGERGVIFARHLRMPDDRIFRGMLGVDDALFAPVLRRRLAAGPWPRKFLYLGRYARKKGLDTMVAGYAQYRAAVTDANETAWPLACYGSGPDQAMLEGHAGVEVNGWAQPAEQPAVLARHGASVLTSHAEPWAVAVAEAMAAGLPAICTEAVGAAADLVRPYHNGLTVPTGDAAAVGRAMTWFHRHADRLPDMGRAARDFAAPYAADKWAERFVEMAHQLRDLPVRR